MRTRGWAGDVPASDEEAVARILQATRRTIDERGEQTSIADVGRSLRRWIAPAVTAGATKVRASAGKSRR